MTKDRTRICNKCIIVDSGGIDANTRRKEGAKWT